MQVTIEYGERCVYVDKITRATQCKEIFSRLQVLTGSKIPENAQMWASGRVLRRQQTVEEVQLMYTDFYHLTTPIYFHGLLHLFLPFFLKGENKLVYSSLLRQV